MPNELANPIALALMAAKQLPRASGQTEHLRSRAHAILADVSRSMEGIAHGGRRKIDELRDALGSLDARDVIAFSSTARRVPVANIPEPDGSTNFAAALRLAQQSGARSVLVISDGRPDDASSALSIASSMMARIDTLYIGPESDAVAIAFMRGLSEAGRLRRGITAIHDLSKQQSRALPAEIKRLMGPVS